MIYVRMLVIVLFVAVGLTACATRNPAISPVKAPVLSTLEEMLQRASELKTNQPEAANSMYRDAAKIYPTSKLPWLRLAQDSFANSDYSNAIQAAQEVVQRDQVDEVALSILAVSGLRVSSASLTSLSKLNGFTKGTREEAAGLTRAIRESLGEQILVPSTSGSQPIYIPSPSPTNQQSRKRATNSKQSTSTAPNGPGSQPQSNDASSDPNPFGKLK